MHSTLVEKAQVHEWARKKQTNSAVKENRAFEPTHGEQSDRTSKRPSENVAGRRSPEKTGRPLTKAGVVIYPPSDTLLKLQPWSSSNI